MSSIKRCNSILFSLRVRNVFWPNDAAELGANLINTFVAARPLKSVGDNLFKLTLNGAAISNEKATERFISGNEFSRDLDALIAAHRVALFVLWLISSLYNSDVIVSRLKDAASGFLAL